MTKITITNLVTGGFTSYRPYNYRCKGAMPQTVTAAAGKDLVAACEAHGIDFGDLVDWLSGHDPELADILDETTTPYYRVYADGSANQRIAAYGSDAAAMVMFQGLASRLRNVRDLSHSTARGYYQST